MSWCARLRLPCAVPQHRFCSMVCGAALHCRPDSIPLQAAESRRGTAAAQINNAGANYCKESYTPEGVGALCQVSCVLFRDALCC